jgi:hypothetical protein
LSIESLVKELRQNNEFQIKSDNNFGHYFIEILKV